VTENERDTRWEAAFRIGLWSAVALGLCLRFWNLGARSFWLDEIFSVWRARLDLTPLWQAPDPHPPLYYLVLAPFVRAGGEAAARLPSALASAASVVLAALVARRRAGSLVGLAVAALVAVSPLDVWYAQEARMYALLGTTVLVAAYGVARGDRLGATVVAAALTVGLFVDYLALAIWATGTGVLASGWWRRGRARNALVTWMLCSAAAGLAAWPLWPHVLDTARVAVAGSYLVRGVPPAVRADAAVWAGALCVAGLAAAATVAALLAGMWHAPPGRWATRLAWTSAVVLGGVTLLAPVPQLYTVKKFAVTVWPMLIVAAALSWRHLSRERQVVAALVAAGAIASVVTLAGVDKDDWRGVVRFLNAECPMAEPLVIADPWDAKALEFYGQNQPALSGRDGAGLREMLGTRGAVWFVAHRRIGQPVPSSQTEAWLDANARLTRRTSFARLEVKRYAPR
jgi:4-amino-4-deoxy-L-arabinose transferase-like glycosyltransferase